MKRLIRDELGNIAELTSVGSRTVPHGWTLLPDEEIQDKSRELARSKALAKIRSKRDNMLLKNDKEWLIASKKGEDTVALEADAQLLRDLPEGAETDLEQLEVENDIENYDPFPSLGLSREY